MGTDHIKNEKNPYEMNVEFIGVNMEDFKNLISHPKSKNSIQNYWKFHYENTTVKIQIEKYFNKLQEFKNKENQMIDLKESLLVKVNSILAPEVDIILDKLNRLGDAKYMPLVLFLVCDTEHMNLIIDQKYKRIDIRLIKIIKYDDKNLENVNANLIRFCSILNELGDSFTIGKDEKAETYDLIENYFPFNINIACLGRFGQGKSTGINMLLGEYKARESTKATGQTLDLTYYQVKNEPIRLLDIPGFEGEDKVKIAVEKLKLCGEKINQIKDNLHIILYFFRYTEDRVFQTMELPIIEELCKHPSSKIIYVITHSDPDMEDFDKEEKIRNINAGVQNLTKDSPINIHAKKGGMLEATENNVVFVNFLRDNKTKFEKFGLKNLFKKIHDSFVESDDYKNSIQNLNKEIIEKNAAKLRAQAEKVVLSNKVGGAVVGIIPGVDWLLQKFVIKKNAAKKIGQIYGINVDFLDEEKKNINKCNPQYVTPSIDESQLNSFKDEDLEESTSFKVGNSLKTTGDAGAIVGGGVAIGSSVAKVVTTAAEGVSTVAEGATTVATGIGSTVLRVAGVGLIIVGAAVGVGLGAYFTNKHCNELIDKFEDYYKKNAEKIQNSYIQAAEYLLNQSELSF